MAHLFALNDFITRRKGIQVIIAEANIYRFAARTMFCVNLAFVQSKPLHGVEKLILSTDAVSRIRESGEDFMQVQRGFIEIIDVSNGGTVSEHSPAAAKDKSFHRTTRDSNGLLIWRKTYLEIFHDLFEFVLDEEVGILHGLSRGIAHLFHFCWVSHILREGGNEEVEINGSTCVRFDTCQPQGPCGCSRNCSGPNWGLWDGLLTSGGGEPPVVSLVEKLPRTSPNLVVGQTDGYGGGTPPLSPAPSEEDFSRESIKCGDGKVGLYGFGTQNLNEFPGKYPENSRDPH